MTIIRWRKSIADRCSRDRWWTGRTGRGDCGPFKGIRRHGRRCLASPNRQGLRRRNSACRRRGIAATRREAFERRRVAFSGHPFSGRGASVEASFPFGPGLALRRTRLHQILTDRASELGVRLLWDTRVGDTSKLPSFRWLVGADGQNSCVRHAARLDAASCGSLSLWISPALPDFAVDRFRRSTLGRTLPGLRDTGERA